MACEGGLPCGDCWLSPSVTHHSFQLCYSSASHTFLARKHIEAETKKQESGDLCPVRTRALLTHPGTGCWPPASDSTPEKCTAQATFRCSDLRFEVHFQTLILCAEPLAHRRPPLSVYGRRGRDPAGKQRDLLADHQQALAGGGPNTAERARSPEQTKSLHTFLFQDPLRMR